MHHEHIDPQHPFDLSWVTQVLASVMTHVEGCADAPNRDTLAKSMKDAIMLAIKLDDEYKRHETNKKD
jgi:hypothetical protein